MRIVLLGPPGAGKGTQAVALASSRMVPHVASGDLFRGHQQKGTELGQLVRMASACLPAQLSQGRSGGPCRWREDAFERDTGTPVSCNRRQSTGSLWVESFGISVRFCRDSLSERVRWALLVAWIVTGAINLVEFWFLKNDLLGLLSLG